jgi:hypothetical protein
MIWSGASASKPTLFAPAVRISGARQEEHVVHGEGEVARVELDPDILQRLDRVNDRPGPPEHGDESLVLRRGRGRVGDAYPVAAQLVEAAEIRVAQAVSDSGLPLTTSPLQPR